MDWLTRAPCKGLHADFFFPPVESKVPNQFYAVGKYVCNACPVWQECKEYGEDNEEVWGLWGGLSPQDRKRPHLLLHGSIERYRSGCRCSQCLQAPKPDECWCDTSSIPKAHQDFDLMEVIFSITSQGA